MKSRAVPLGYVAAHLVSYWPSAPLTNYPLPPVTQCVAAAPRPAPPPSLPPRVPLLPRARYVAAAPPPEQAKGAAPPLPPPSRRPARRGTAHARRAPPRLQETPPRGAAQPRRRSADREPALYDALVATVESHLIDCGACAVAEWPWVNATFSSDGHVRRPRRVRSPIIHLIECFVVLSSPSCIFSFVVDRNR